MEQETLFTASKWDILKLLSESSQSPLQLAKKSNTSVANISQQLRLLEMAGLVQSERISNRDKGQPRLLYSLAGNHSFLIASTQDFVQKKFFKLSDYNKIILKIWFLDNPEIHYYLEKAFWHIEEKINDIQAILLEQNKPELTLTIVSDKKTIAPKKLTIKDPDGKTKTINLNIKTPSEFKPSKQLYSLYDPNNLQKNEN